ncbi:MAG: hypothetical protein IJO50_04955 [Clostridia bacterium]|nr:hypothetical protein [Clostridia bacterium]
MKSKILLGVFALVLTCGSLVGCGGNMEDDMMPTPSASAPASATVSPAETQKPEMTVAPTASPGASATSAAKAMFD